MKYFKKLFVEKSLTKEMEDACGCEMYNVHDGEVLFDEEVKFSNGMRMAIQVIAEQMAPCWTQGVLFDGMGNELGCTNVGEDFLGEYTVFHGEDEYTAVVVVG